MCLEWTQKKRSAVIFNDIFFVILYAILLNAFLLYLSTIQTVDLIVQTQKCLTSLYLVGHHVMKSDMFSWASVPGREIKSEPLSWIILVAFGTFIIANDSTWNEGQRKNGIWLDTYTSSFSQFIAQADFHLSTAQFYNCLCVHSCTNRLLFQKQNCDWELWHLRSFSFLILSGGI